MDTSKPFTPTYAHITGWGMAVPEDVLTNEDLAAIVETSDAWIHERTGIRQRYIAGERETTATLGLKAAQNALEVADVLPIELDLIIVATSTPDNIFPSTASMIQDWLGAGKAGAFDLSAACSGFVYAVDMAAGQIRAGSISTALVIGAETMSRVLDWQDRATCILFGDGAGAVVLQARPEAGGVLASLLRSDGAGGDLLGIPSVGSLDAPRNGHKPHKMHMIGGEVFKFGTRVIVESVKQVTQRAGITLDQLRLIIPHQANERILTAAARSLELDKNIFMSNVERFGNTSAASIPIALVEAVECGRLKPGDYLALVGFGGGLAWAAMIVEWSGTHPEIRFGSQRRQFSYILAAWRTRLMRWWRTLLSVGNRVRPKRTSIERLRRRMERTNWE